MAPPEHSLGDVFALLNRLRAEGVIESYAIVGAMAGLFYAEATPTFDLDVAVAFPEPTAPHALASLTRLYDWLRREGFSEEGPHVRIFGVPVQFLPGDTGLWREVVEEARELDYDGTPVRVARPEHLVAMGWAAPSPRRLQRVAALLESPDLDSSYLSEILARHDIARR